MNNNDKTKEEELVEATLPVEEKDLFMTQEAQEALQHKDTTSGGINAQPGDVFHITGIDFRSNYIKPDAVDAAIWRDATEEQRKEMCPRGLTEWYVLLTDKGDLSWSQFISATGLRPKEWEAAEHLEGVNPSQYLRPCSKRMSVFKERGYECFDQSGQKFELPGTTIQCIGALDKDGAFKQKFRGFIRIASEGQAKPVVLVNTPAATEDAIDADAAESK